MSAIAPSLAQRLVQRVRGADFWSLVMLASLAVVSVVLLWPILQVLRLGVFDPESQQLSGAGYVKLLTHPYYLGALWNTVLVGVGGAAALTGVVTYVLARKDYQDAEDLNPTKYSGDVQKFRTSNDS